MTLRGKLIAGLGVSWLLLAVAGFAAWVPEGRTWVIVALAAAAIFQMVSLIALWRGITSRLRGLNESLHALQTDTPLPPPRVSHDALSQLGDTITAVRQASDENRRADAARLVRLQQATRSAIDALPHAVAIISPDGNVELANRVAESMFALSPGPLTPDRSPAWLPALLEKVQRTQAAVKPDGYASAVQVFDKGRELFFLPHAIPLFDADQKIVGITLLLENATELRHVEEAKSDLLAMVSHELKTPLTSIQMAIHLLLEDPRGAFTGRERELLQTAGEDAERLHLLIQRLLDQRRQ